MTKTAAGEAATSGAARFLEDAGTVVRGEGSPLLCINGLLHTAELWDPVLAPLTARHRTVRFDFPHQNGSPRAGRYAGFDRYCDFVVDMVDALGLDPAHTDAFGFSVGGDVLRTLAVERGFRFRRIIVGASAPPGIERFWGTFFTGALDLVRKGAFDDFIRLIAFQFYSPLYIEQYPKLLNVMHMKYRQRFADTANLEALLEIPLQRRPPDPARDAVLAGGAALVNCLHDHLVPIGAARDYARRTGIAYHEIETGHSFLAESPAEAVRLARTILNGED
ncbi:MAG TPA: alpha/beta hydrolase [Arenibaculum sp.]|nr:alpha/beta hydrolase [Arenibaculum sp.]